MNINQLKKSIKKQASVIPALASGVLTATDPLETSKVSLPLINAITTGAGSHVSGQASKVLALAAKKPRYALAAELVGNLLGAIGTHTALRAAQRKGVSKQASVKTAGKLGDIIKATLAVPGKAYNKAKLNADDTVAALLTNLGIADSVSNLNKFRKLKGMPANVADARLNKGNRNLTGLLVGGVPVAGGLWSSKKNKEIGLKNDEINALNNTIKRLTAEKENTFLNSIKDNKFLNSVKDNISENIPSASSIKGMLGMQ